MNRVRRMIGCDRLDISQYNGKGVYAAVLDSGVARHPDLDGRIIEFHDFIHERGTYEAQAYYDDNGHGTHV